MKVDLRLPLPLTQPELWPHSTHAEILFSIFALSWGGPIQDRLHESVLSERLVTFEMPEEFWKKSSEVEAAVFSERLLEFPKAKVELQSLAHRSPRLADWAAAVFPETVRALGELKFRCELEIYAKELGDPFANLDTLRFFPGFLRRRRIEDSIHNGAVMELAKVTALFSPQNDSHGNTDSFTANQTLQTVAAEELFAIYRFEGRLSEAKLTWQEAAVLDELRENPKLSLEALPPELSDETFKSAIDFMLARGLLLRSLKG